MSRPRLTGGHARGRILAMAPPPGVRPTSARVREALFSMIGQDLSDQRVLDAFGGSGLLALEAWSRGAEVVVVERDRAALRALRANVAALSGVVTLCRGDVLQLVCGLGLFDGALLDPPYALDPQPILEAIAPSVSGWLALELDAARRTPDAPGLVLDRRRCYGGTDLCVYVRRGG
ncbi:MAG TPA: 16S rRNA (guanine(966)-N(2))-methyltransferase RsmD [Deltaproteobacteria bacterium]|nr:16S rRNA (guanine(966)-N(2))-methyltransferase RsmD [Deltaproteobacteria bacterium]